MMLSNADLAWMRTTQAANLPDELIVQTRVIEISDEGATEADTWNDGATVPCRIAPIAQVSGDENVVAEKVTERPLYQLTFPLTVAISPLNRVNVNGLIYEVESVEDAREHQTVGRALIRRLD